MPVSLPEHFEDFAEARRNGFIQVKELKDRGETICGAFCQYTPAEVIMAAGLYQVSLCGRSQSSIPAAETRLPENLCPLIKSSYGHALEDSCPYAYFSDIVVGETTCDGKKKMYELLGDIKDMHVIHLPNLPDYDRSLEMWVDEIRRFARSLEEKTGNIITEEKLNEAIRWCNKERKQAARIYELGKYDPPAITGMKMCDVMEGEQYMFDIHEKYDKINEVLDKCEEEWRNGNAPFPADPYMPRIVISGASIGGAIDKTLKVIEELGAAIVCYEGCGGISSRRRLVSEDESRDPYVRIAEKYIEVPCAVMSPNKRRMKQVVETVEEWNADAVISITLHSCNPFAVETENIRRVCEKQGLDFLHIETTFAPGDEAQIRTRLEAFIEVVRGKKESRAHESQTAN